MNELELPSASKAETAEACLGSIILPKNKQESSELATDGTIRHEYIAKVLNLATPEQALVGIPERLVEDCRSIDTPAIERLVHGQTEVTFVWNAESGVGRVLGSHLERDYRKAGWNPASEYVGTADYHGYLNEPPLGRVLVIDDFKTGDGDVTHPQDNLQLAINAVGAAAYYGEERVLVRIVRTARTIRYSGYLLEAIHLDLIRERLRLLRDRALKAHQQFISTGIVQTNPGDYCKYCESFDYCPSKKALIQSFVSSFQKNGDLSTQEIEEGILLAGDTTVALTQFKAAEAFMKKLDIALRNIASRKPIKTADGKFWGPTPVSRESIDAKIAMETINDWYGPEAVKRATDINITKEGIKRAAAFVAEERGLKAAVVNKNILAEIHNNGGITNATRTEYRKYDPE